MIIEGNELWLAKNLHSLSKLPESNISKSNFYKVSFQVVRSKLRIFRLENYQDYPIFYLNPKVELKLTSLNQEGTTETTKEFLLKNTAPENLNLVIADDFICGPVINYSINYNYAHSYFYFLGIRPLKIIPFYENEISLAIFKWSSEVVNQKLIDFVNQKSVEFVKYERNPETLKELFLSLVENKIYLYN